MSAQMIEYSNEYVEKVLSALCVVVALFHILFAIFASRLLFGRDYAGLAATG